MPCFNAAAPRPGYAPARFAVLLLFLVTATVGLAVQVTSGALRVTIQCTGRYARQGSSGVQQPVLRCSDGQTMTLSGYPTTTGATNNYTFTGLSAGNYSASLVGAALNADGWGYNLSIIGQVDPNPNHSPTCSISASSPTIYVTGTPGRTTSATITWSASDSDGNLKTWCFWRSDGRYNPSSAPGSGGGGSYSFSAASQCSVTFSVEATDATGARASGSVTVKVEAAAIPQYSVAIATDGNGSASASKTKGLSASDAPSISYAANLGYEFDFFSGDLVTGGTIPITVNGQAANRYVMVHFRPIAARPTISAQATTGVPASPAPSISATPSSGSETLGTIVSWNPDTAGSFTVTRNGSYWANSGTSRSDSLSAGTYTYRITSQPASYRATLSWSATNATSYRVTGPSGYDSGSITSTSCSVTVPGSYTVTATGAGGSASTSVTAPSVSTGSASCSVVVDARPAVPPTVTAAPATGVTAAPTVSIAATPDSGTETFSTAISWSVQNASSFTVTKNTATWATAGTSKADTLAAGTYVYQITAQPSAYSATLNWTASDATNYRVTGPAGYDSGRLDGTSCTVPEPGTYTVTATGPGGSVTATLEAPAEGEAATASCTVAVNSSQWVSLTPSNSAITAGDSVPFSASGGHNGYVWGGEAAGAGASQTVRFPLPGAYQVTVLSPAGNGYGVSNTAIGKVAVNPAAQTVTITPAATLVAPGQSTTLTANGGMNGYVWDGIATGGGTTKTFAFDAPGLYTATAYSPAGGSFGLSNTAVARITVALPQTINFPPPGSFLLRSLGTTLVATATSGLPVRFTVISGPGSLTSPTFLRFGTIGAILVQADQDGDATYQPAPPVRETVTVISPPDTTLKFTGSTGLILERHQDTNHSLPEKP